MMAVTKAPEVWAAGVPIVPFVNWFTEIENEDPVLQQSDLATMGDPVKNKALYEERSPINFVDQIKAPLLLLAGGHDPRCPKSETEQVVAAIRKRGGTVDSKVYDGWTVQSLGGSFQLGSLRSGSKAQRDSGGRDSSTAWPLASRPVTSLRMTEKDVIALEALPAIRIR
jgi:hypothetical protein